MAVVLLRRMLVGVNVQVKPVEGEIVGASETVPVKPWRPVTVIVEPALVPAIAVMVVGFAARA